MVGFIEKKIIFKLPNEKADRALYCKLNSRYFLGNSNSTCLPAEDTGHLLDVRLALSLE